MRALPLGKIKLQRGIAVFIALAGIGSVACRAAISAPDEAKTADDAAQQPPPLPPNQIDPKELKSFKTPFGVSSSQSAQTNGDALPSSLNGFGDLRLSNAQATDRPRRLDLSRSLKLFQPQLFLPGRLVLGKTAEFTVKGQPGSWVALAMADKDKGAKPILGHKIRLGPDRKVVAAGQIPATGLLALDIQTPIEGDLIGGFLYFEAAVWSQPDMSDTQVIAVVPSESQPDAANGVLISGQPSDKKARLLHINNAAQQSLSRIESSDTTNLESGKP